MEYQVEKHQAD